jgi:hypothetical protein
MKKAPILYFFPGSSEIPKDIPEVAARFATAAATRATGLVRIPAEGIPAGTLAAPASGVFVSSGDPAYRWHEYVPDRCWIGVLRDLKPEMVKRDSVPRSITGNPVRMADGNDWILPVANPFSRRLGLPACSVPVVTDGKTVWRKRVIDQYADLAAQAEAIAAQLRESVIDGRGTITIPDDQIREILGQALSLFYDITLPEIAVAGLVNPDDCLQAIHVLTDWRAMEEEFRKAIEEVAGGRPPFGD